LDANTYLELKRTAEQNGLTLKEALKEAVLDWIRAKSGFDQGDPLFKTLGMFYSRADLAEKHDEVYSN
jgi:hypothetical protein